MRNPGRGYIPLALLGAFGVAAGGTQGDPLSILLPVGAATYGFGHGVSSQGVVRGAVAAAAVAVMVFATPVPSWVLTAAVISVAAAEVVSRATWSLYEDEGTSAGAYLAGGGVVSMAAVLALEAEAATAALVVVSCLYAAGTVRAMEFGVGWSVLAAGAAAVFAVTAPVEAGVWGVASAAAVTLAFGAVAYRADVMTLAGAAAGVLLTFTLVMSGGFGWFVVLGAFVVLGSLSTRYRSGRKQEMGYGHDGPRDVANVAANGTVAFVAAVAFAFVSGWGWESIPLVETAFVASVATAAADTASSEIGVVHGDPKLITDMEPVEPGADGGVSAVGETVALAASVAVAGLALVLGLLTPSLALIAAASGLLGCNVDSLLGATLEGRLLTNESVNLAATASGAVAAVALAVVV